MSMRKVYKCNLCQDEKEVGDLVGLYFSNLNNFRIIDDARQVDGQHICSGCIKQLRGQLTTETFECENKK